MADNFLELKVIGYKIIPMQEGDSDFATPSIVVNAAIDAMHEGLTHYEPNRHYLDSRGKAPLK